MLLEMEITLFDSVASLLTFVEIINLRRVENIISSQKAFIIIFFFNSIKNSIEFFLTFYLRKNELTAKLV